MISVIIPTFNEERNIVRTLQKLSQEVLPHEVIVVDGGSQDRTVEFARPHAEVVFSRKGRGIQMNEGAKGARGDILFFLHGDCEIEEGALKVIEDAVRNGYVGGCLTHKIQDPRFIFRLIESSGNIRALWRKIFYGDQGIFIRADVFRELSGFKPFPIFEDVEFSRRLRRKGRTVILRHKLYTSNRRWVRQGVLKTMMINGLLLFLYHVGCPTDLLAKWYRDLR